MGRSLLLAFAVIVFCALAVHARGPAPNRLRGRPTKPTTQRPTTGSPPVGAVAARKSKAEAAAGDRRNKAINRAPAAETRGSKPIVVSMANGPSQSFGKGSHTPTYGALPDNAQTPYGIFKIIDGKVTIFGYTYLFCGGSFYLEDEFICCNNVPIPQTPHDPVECCGSEYYFPQSEICCNGLYYNKVENGYKAECCGDVFYLPAIETCCNGDFRPKKKWGCCNNKWFNKNKARCCGNVWYKFKKGFKCCGPYYRNSQAFICCNKEPFHKLFHRCCKGKRFIHLSHKCCKNGNIVKKNQSCYDG